MFRIKSNFKCRSLCRSLSVELSGNHSSSVLFIIFNCQFPHCIYVLLYGLFISTPHFVSMHSYIEYCSNTNKKLSNAHQGISHLAKTGTIDKHHQLVHTTYLENSIHRVCFPCLARHKKLSFSLI